MVGLEEGRRRQEGDEGRSGLFRQGGPRVDQEVRLRVAEKVCGEQQLVAAHRHGANQGAAIACGAGGQVDHIVCNVERLLGCLWCPGEGAIEHVQVQILARLWKNTVYIYYDIIYI